MLIFQYWYLTWVFQSRVCSVHRGWDLHHCSRTETPLQMLEPWETCMWYTHTHYPLTRESLSHVLRSSRRPAAPSSWPSQKQPVNTPEESHSSPHCRAQPRVYVCGVRAVLRLASLGPGRHVSESCRGCCFNMQLVRGIIQDLVLNLYLVCLIGYVVTICSWHKSLLGSRLGCIYTRCGGSHRKWNDRPCVQSPRPTQDGGCN